MKTILFELLIPLTDNSGHKFTDSHNAKFFQFVRNLAGGLTALSPANGQWVDSGKVYKERVRPIRIACNPATIRKIAEYAKQFYKQFSIMYYQLSNKVHFFNG